MQIRFEFDTDAIRDEKINEKLGELKRIENIIRKKKEEMSEQIREKIAKEYNRRLLISESDYF